MRSEPRATPEVSQRPLYSSFRDPGGIVFPFQGRILRLLNSSGVDDARAFLNSKLCNVQTEYGSVVGTKWLSQNDRQALVNDPAIRAAFGAFEIAEILEHERIPFASFPYEWAPEMLEAAGQLTLSLARKCLDEHLGLKDATPLNILFRGPEPVFIDVLSFERRDPCDPTWLPYAQFVRTFLLPLLASRHFGVPLSQSLLSRRDGLEPEEVYRWLGPLARFRPEFFGNVSMPVWLDSRHKKQDTTIYEGKRVDSPEKARFIVDSLLQRLQNSLRRAAPREQQRSTWSNYMTGNNNYSQQQFEAKERFVSEVLREFGPATVLDVGCNTGVFSALAARSGAAVVAIDYDPVVSGQVWRRARAEQLNILPLVVDLTRPTPAVGWRNNEWSSFLERASGNFDVVLMLAVIHHMLVTERVPLPEIMSMAAQLTRNMLIVEFIEPEDSMFRQLARGRDHLHRELTVAHFEDVCRQRFEIIRSARLPGAHRSIYLLQRKT